MNWPNISNSREMNNDEIEAANILQDRSIFNARQAFANYTAAAHRSCIEDDNRKLYNIFNQEQYSQQAAINRNQAEQHFLKGNEHTRLVEQDVRNLGDIISGKVSPPDLIQNKSRFIAEIQSDLGNLKQIEAAGYPTFRNFVKGEPDYYQFPES